MQVLATLLVYAAFCTPYLRPSYVSACTLVEAFAYMPSLTMHVHTCTHTHARTHSRTQVLATLLLVAAACTRYVAHTCAITCDLRHAPVSTPYVL